MALSRKIIETLSHLLKDEKEVAFLLYPNHWNVGDSAIWYGTIVALRQLGIRVRYIANHKTYTALELKRHVPNGPILLCGGGNFGDLYPDEGGLRLRVLKDFQDREVIQLPQSIWYDDPKNANAIKPFIQNKNFHLLVRDKDSLARAAKIFGIKATLCPDMAFMLEGILRVKPHQYTGFDFRYLKRDDKESQSSMDPKEQLESKIVTDWLQEDDEYLHSWPIDSVLTHKIVQKWIDGTKLPMWIVVPAANKLAKERTNAGLILLQQGEHLVTDRLHAGIMGAITGQRVSMIDNVYGKNGSLYSAWLQNHFSNISIYDSFKDFYAHKNKS
jgi:exopolysaccharide biosynthesis predicted pyruvyltransferase EpsI